MKPRHELKHAINYSDYLAMCARLRQVMRRDTFSGVDGEYRIRSLYFDNYRDKALTEKVIGVTRREKFRIRFYNGDDTFLRLEKKAKRRELSVKRSAPLTKEETRRLLLCGGEGVEPAGREVLSELLAKMKTEQLRPKTVVDYRREAYVLPAGNVRVTFDKEVRTGLFDTSFLEERLPLVPVTPPGVMILEVKYDEFLPEIVRDIVQVGERRCAAISKYLLCRNF